MLFKKKLRSEIANTTGAIFLILITIIFIFMMVRSLSYVNQGQISPADTLLLISLSSVIYIPHIIIASLFIATTFVLVKWYETSEMIVWQSSGLSLIKFLLPILNTTLPFFVLITIFSIFIWPWSNNYIEQLKENFKQKDQLSLLVSGQFFEIEKSNKTIFIENLESQNKEKNCLNNNKNINCNISIDGIFATNMQYKDNNIIDIFSSKSGKLNNNRKALLLNGERYIIDLTNNSMQKIKYDELKLNIKNKQAKIVDIENYPARALSSKYLLHNITNINLVELMWRILMPFSLLILQICSLALSYYNHRKGKYFSIISAIVLYIVYNNLINITTTWLEKKATSNLYIITGMSIVHIVFLILGLLILIYRTYNFYFINKIYSKIKLRQLR